MKILVLGAGAIGGYFGARLVQARADVHFLVRERRAALLAGRGLVVRSPHGDFTVPARTLLAGEVQPGWDLVLLTCKSYDLDAAIASVAPALGERTLVLPLLNGLAHIERLRAAFGAARVLGGTCVIPATLTPEGEVQHLGTPHRITFGPLAGTRAGAAHDLEPLREAFARGPVEAVLADDMAQPLWEKFVGLATLAAMTCLMRAAVGDIVASDDGALLMEDTLRACVATATAAGHAPREAALAPLRAMLFAPGSDFTASMLRDLEAGSRTEADHVVGDMLRRAVAAGVDPGPLRHARCHLQAAERRRARGG
jgi:2-dehydropantoate 2-reductase